MSAGAVEYTDYISADRLDISLNECPVTPLNNLKDRLQDNNFVEDWSAFHYQ